MVKKHQEKTMDSAHRRKVHKVVLKEKSAHPSCKVVANSMALTLERMRGCFRILLMHAATYITNYIYMIHWLGTTTQATRIHTYLNLSNTKLLPWNHKSILVAASSHDKRILTNKRYQY